MPRVAVSVTQSGNDTTTAALISTGLTVDGKAGW